MGFWGKLFGTDKALEEGIKTVGTSVTGVISGIDAAFYTKEEKVNDIKEVLFKLQDQYTPRSMSRRILAVMFAIDFSILMLTALIFACFGKTDIVARIIEVANAFSMGTIMLTVIVFFFGYYGVQKYNESKK